MSIKSVLKANNNAELLSYIINQTPELSADIDLPVQGESIKPIGKIIMSNERYKNAFINTINLIGLTVIDRNYWRDPWEDFAERGVLNYGESVRELMVDIANVYDYNAYANDPDHFLETVVPNVYNYIHEVNYQKFYKTTTSDEQMAMAFDDGDGLFNLIESIIGSLYEGYKYDKYLVAKYMLCRRILDGTVTSIEIDGYDNLTPRQRVAFVKNVSNKMTFRSPNYNPAGVRVATAFEDQIMILNTDFDADLSTDVLATSFFRNDAEMKARLALIDGYDNHDSARLTELLGSAYVPFTSAELTALGKIPAVIIDREWFQIYNYAFDNMAPTRRTDFFNPESLKNTHWLHAWKVVSTSPFKNAVVFTKDVTPAVSAVSVSPSTATTEPGQKVQLSATVTTAGFANKAVVWAIDSDDETGEGKTASVDMNGLVTIPSGHASSGSSIVVSATSVFDDTKSDTATITVGTASAGTTSNTQSRTTKSDTATITVGTASAGTTSNTQSRTTK